MTESGLWWLLPVGLWIIWWLWAANWQKLWPVLAGGAWAPAVLLFLMGAVVWSRLEPWRFAWQLGIVAALAILALFCGWLQGQLRCTPRDISVEPPVVSDEGHGHSH
jgi:low affinity Fe/Cu permease